MHKGHRLLPSGRRRDHFSAIGVLLLIPLGQGLIVATLPRMEESGHGLRRGLGRLGVSPGRWLLLGLRLSVMEHRDNERAISVSDNIHGERSPWATSWMTPVDPGCTHSEQ